MKILGLQELARLVRTIRDLKKLVRTTAATSQVSEQVMLIAQQITKWPLLQHATTSNYSATGKYIHFTADNPRSNQIRSKMTECFTKLYSTI